MGKTIEAKASIGNKNKKSSDENGQKDICFVIMPFGGWSDKYYQDIFCPAIQDAGLQPRRADDIYRTGSIVHDIWELTKMADVILADLTGKNPNVLYELGLAHALAKPAIMVTETFVDIPFDLRALRIIEYDRNAPAWGELLKENITKSIEEVMKDPQKAVPPAFLEVDNEGKITMVSPIEKEILELRKDLNSLRREMRTRDIGSPSISPSASPSPSPMVGRILSEKEAEEEIEQLLAKGMPESGIIKRMNSLGIPFDWSVDILERKHMGG